MEHSNSFGKRVYEEVQRPSTVHDVERSSDSSRLKLWQLSTRLGSANMLKVLAMFMLAMTPAAGWQLIGPGRGHRFALTSSTDNHARIHSAFVMGEDDFSPWSAEEDWALIDQVDDFSAGRGRDTATFWTALTASSPVLYRRSGSECLERMAQLVLEQNVTRDFGPEPEVLEAWSRQSDGRITGSIGGRTVWLQVEQEARLASDPRPGAGYIETLAGRVFELGRPVDSNAVGAKVEVSADKSTDDLVGQAQPALQSSNAMPMVFTAAVAASLSFLLGSATFPTQSGPAVAVPATSQSTVKQAAKSSAPAPAPALALQATTPRAEKVMLKLSEQKERQQIRVDADELRLNNLRDRLRTLDDSYDTKLNNLKDRLKNDIERDQKAIDNYDSKFQDAKTSLTKLIADQELRVRMSKENLVELSRVEAERGGDANAVQITLFPPSTEVAQSNQFSGGAAIPTNIGSGGSAEKVILNQADAGPSESATTGSGALGAVRGER